ncbi:hypothetical protein Bbelb_274540, partial [Branchiostoma belcheri]
MPKWDRPKLRRNPSGGNVSPASTEEAGGGTPDGAASGNQTHPPGTTDVIGTEAEDTGHEDASYSHHIPFKASTEQTSLTSRRAPNYTDLKPTSTPQEPCSHDDSSYCHPIPGTESTEDTGSSHEDAASYSHHIPFKDSKEQTGLNSRRAPNYTDLKPTSTPQEPCSHDDSSYCHPIPGTESTEDTGSSHEDAASYSHHIPFKDSKEQTGLNSRRAPNYTDLKPTSTPQEPCSHDDSSYCHPMPGTESTEDTGSGHQDASYCHHIPFKDSKEQTGLNSSRAQNYTDLKPTGTSTPQEKSGEDYAHLYRTLDHVVVSSDHPYDKPEDVYNKPEDVYDKAEDVYRYKDPEEVSCAYKARERVVEMWNSVKLSGVFWGCLACGLLLVTSAITASILFTHFLSGKADQADLMGNSSELQETSNWTIVNFDFVTFPTTVVYLSVTDIDECASKPRPCLHGTCVDKDGGYNCTCSPGWTGQDCQQDINECASKPCLHGTCVNKDGGYMCICSSGWTGQNCQQDINECASKPCHYGICVNQDGGYKCTCSHGWTGQNCQQDINECSRSPCQHGTCANHVGGYTCSCSHGWTGQNCQQDKNECNRNPCQHGTCANQDGGYKCTCSHGWIGQNCHQAWACRHGWSEHNNHCYKLMNEKVSFSTANQRCKEMGANLASIRDRQENNFIASIISAANTQTRTETEPSTEGDISFPGDASCDMVWIGLQHNMWTDGSAFSYRNWAPGQPDDNKWFGGEKCVVIYKNMALNNTQSSPKDGTTPPELPAGHPTLDAKEKKQAVSKEEEESHQYVDVDLEYGIGSVMILGSGFHRAAPPNLPPRNPAQKEKGQKQAEIKQEEEGHTYVDVDLEYGIENVILGSGFQHVGQEHASGQGSGAASAASPALCLDMGDHVIVWPEQKEGSEQQNKPGENTGDEDHTQDVGQEHANRQGSGAASADSPTFCLDMGDHVIVWPEQKEGSEQQNKPEETTGYEEGEGRSFAAKARDRAMQMFDQMKSKLPWLIMVLAISGLLIIVAVATAVLLPTRSPGKGENLDGAELWVIQQNSTASLWTPFYKETSSTVGHPTSLSSLSTGSVTSAEVVLTTLAPLSTTVDIDECVGKPCEQGRCLDKDCGYIDECTKNQCQHGSCVNKDGGYNCTCSPGWTGQNCQRDIDECTKNPCQHGRCVNQDDGYKCTCSPGWTGQNCQRDIDECTKNPCQHGRCVNKDGGYKCTCSPGWTGQNCQRDIDECTKNPCQHGRCVNKDGGYKCTCSSGWTGQNCQR